MQVEDEQKHAQIPTKGGADNAQTAQLEDAIFKVSGQLSTISRMQKYFRTRENRNFSTVQSTEQRIFNFSLVEVAMMVGMAALQVLVVRFFFQGARKGKFTTADIEYSTLMLYRLRLNECSYRDIDKHITGSMKYLSARAPRDFSRPSIIARRTSRSKHPKDHKFLLPM